LNDVKTRENITRQLLKLDYDYTNTDNSWFQSASASIYGQHSKNHQWGYEARSSTSGWNSRTRDTEYGEKVAGGNLQLESNFGNAVAHRLIYGVDASLTKVESLKEGNNMRDGVSLTGSAGFKVNKSFPDTDYRLLGAFIQDEISIDNLAIIPGLRYDSFKLTPKPDALYAVNNSIAPTTLSGNELSPKLGLSGNFHRY
jgi:hemoglobin/transferrin/lactoferrin receptor protein